MNSNFKTKPFIRLSGEWLRELGFETGERFQLTVTDNKIILQQINKEA
ncbi:MAG: hypothetical protein CMF23_17985 [Ignavibacteriae bacterium]|nr:hypothetical protein [Ignavibacteriota bacterium]|tara:strand:+ start:362 stop:505 length:144 start_codon:yes stop_codon:yes gene_type:complete